MSMHTVTGIIYPHNVSALLRGVRRFSKRVAELGEGEIDVELSALKTFTGMTARGHFYEYEAHAVTVSYEQARICGWEFVARIEHMGDAGAIVKPVPGYKPSKKWHAAKDWCDHCQKANKGRKDSYLLRRVGSVRVVRQVGRTCIRKFIGLSPKEAFAAIDFGEWISMAIGPEDGRGLNFFEGARRGYTLSEYLPHVAVCIRHYGWASMGMVRKGDAEHPTSFRAAANINPPKAVPGCAKVIVYEPEAQDVELAEKAASWAARQDPRSSDYLSNIKVIAKGNYFLRKQSGYAASIISAYQRAQEWTKRAERERAAALPSEHRGEVGERIVIEGAKLKAVRHVDGVYGLKVMHRWITESGDVIVWWSSGAQLGERGRTMTIRGTVKKHGEYKGIKDTTLTRVSEVTS